MQIKLKLPELPIVTKIAQRCYIALGWPEDEMFDVIACVHSNGCPLDLEKLLRSSDRDFAYDMAFCRYELDRETGKLGPYGLPRCAMKN